jgi:hypothetical protein
LGSHGQLKSQPGYSFSELIFFLEADVYEGEKLTTFNQHMMA